MEDWGHQLLEGIKHCAALLDQAYDTGEHMQSLALQQARLDDVRLTPSAQVLEHMRSANCSFAGLALQLSREHAEQLASRPLNATLTAHYQQLAATSHARQHALEAEPQVDFDDYMQQWG